jgi:small subunit ribosomal protein S21
MSAVREYNGCVQKLGLDILRQHPMISSTFCAPRRIFRGPLLQVAGRRVIPKHAQESWFGLEVYFHLAEVKLQEGETLENALRRFKRKVQQEDIIKEVKRHSFYLKPGEKLRAKQALARKRNRKKSRREVE